MKKYEKIKSLGEGATAEVFLVKEVNTEQYYAMKIGRVNILDREAEFLKEMKSQYFPRFVEYVRRDRGYLVMEYIQGETLQQLLDRNVKFRLSQIVSIMDSILRGISELHNHVPCIIYQDLKAANVMLDNTGRVRLIDLGAACFSDKIHKEKTEMHNSIRAGTYGYAAPEQFWQGMVPDEKSDIYAAGKILAYLLSGKNPAVPPYNMLNYCRNRNNIPKEFVAVLERCLAMNPAARYENCENLRREIHRAIAESGKRKLFRINKKSSKTYEKCIWLSEYRRIF